MDAQCCNFGSSLPAQIKNHLWSLCVCVCMFVRRLFIIDVFWSVATLTTCTFIHADTLNPTLDRPSPVQPPDATEYFKR